MSDGGGTYILSRKKVSNFYFSGQQCTVMCFNGGTCVRDTCVCKEGFSGNFCQTRKFFFRIKKNFSFGSSPKLFWFVITALLIGLKKYSSHILNQSDASDARSLVWHARARFLALSAN